MISAVLIFTLLISDRLDMNCAQRSIIAKSLANSVKIVRQTCPFSQSVKLEYDTEILKI